jgi:hypothetical protein
MTSISLVALVDILLPLVTFSLVVASLNGLATYLVVCNSLMINFRKHRKVSRMLEYPCQTLETLVENLPWRLMRNQRRPRKKVSSSRLLFRIINSFVLSTRSPSAGKRVVYHISSDTCSWLSREKDPGNADRPPPVGSKVYCPCPGAKQGGSRSACTFLLSGTARPSSTMGCCTAGRMSRWPFATAVACVDQTSQRPLSECC